MFDQDSPGVGNAKICVVVGPRANCQRGGLFLHSNALRWHSAPLRSSIHGLCHTYTRKSSSKVFVSFFTANHSVRASRVGVLERRARLTAFCRHHTLYRYAKCDPCCRMHFTFVEALASATSRRATHAERAAKYEQVPRGNVRTSKAPCTGTAPIALDGREGHHGLEAPLSAVRRGTREYLENLKAR